MEKRRYATIDYMKFICAILVVGIHTEPFGFSFLLDKGFGLITRIAVPFFFIASSFFFSKRELSWKHCFNYCVRILKLYVIWSFILLVVLTLSGKPSDDFFYHFFIRGYEHLWFLHACIIAAIMLTVLHKVFYKNLFAMVMIAIILYAFGTIISTYSNAIKIPIQISTITDFIGTRNGVLYGFPFLLWVIILPKMIKKKCSNLFGWNSNLLCSPCS